MKMNHVPAGEFWDRVEALDTKPLGPRAVVEVDMQETSCFTQVTVGAKMIGEEVSYHPTGSTLCYLSEDAAVA